VNSVKAILILENNNALSGVMGSAPAVLVDVMGNTTLQRTIDSLKNAGVSEVVVIAESDSASPEVRDVSVNSARLVRSGAENLWRTAEAVFVDCAETANHVFLLRMNAYLELNWEAIIQHHERHINRVTQVWYGNDLLNESKPLDVFLASASRRNEAAFLLRSGLRQLRTECIAYEVGQNNDDEYVNLLEHEFDFRRLASDALHCTCKLRPEGKEIRPGIWVGKGARIDRNARLVAPVYVGARAQICPGAVVTRGSVVERHSIVGRGTVVENATILPYTRVGPGLEICHSLVGDRHIFHLPRNLCTPVQDPRLVGQVSANVGKRLLGSTAALVTFLPWQIWRAMAGQEPRPATDSPINYAESFKTVEKQPAEMTAGLAVARRYGNQ
jgi:carbonic anhydrase/acetyltransferase-like protein (isoleucine patch superfamily)